MRVTRELQNGWYFLHEDRPPEGRIPADAVPVTLPHSWNAVDGHDGHTIDVQAKDWSLGDLSGKPVEHYDRGTYWYYREITTIPQPLPGGRLYLEIPAAGLQAKVYINGKLAAEHDGGYSLFRADLTDSLNADGPSLLAVQVCNEYRSNVYPHHADFTFYGGLYRGARLVSVAEAHFDMDHLGSCGLKVTPAPEEDGWASFRLEAWTAGTDENHTVFYTIEDMEGREVAAGARPAADPGLTLWVPAARLWSPEDPYLYRVTARILRRNEVTDEVSARCGVRSFSCDPDRGFILNGKPTPLRGVCRHQDRLYLGNALTAAEHFEDARIIKELGANAIRLAHYQHDQRFYDACDELGLVVWAEIPFITIMSEDPAAHENCRSMMKELIIQSYNHPCICFWGLSNEVLLAGKLSEQLVENHRDLNRLVKSLDPTRLTTIAHVSTTPEDCGLCSITDVEAWNHYFGWYNGSMEDNARWLDAYHRNHPERCLGVSEYGCEGIITYHSAEPESKDYSEEYQALYHEELARVFAERPYVWGSFLWNMFDFGAAARNEGGVAGRNNKGLVTMDRKIRKDSYYIYQAWWTSEPMVHICGKRYAQRAGETTEIRVYSNQPVVSLYLNGELVEVQAADKVFVFRVALRPGMNRLTADAGKAVDTAVLEKVDEEPAIYTLPGIVALRRLRREWFDGADEADLEAPATPNEGAWSVFDRLRDLLENDQTAPLVKQALAIALKTGEPDKLPLGRVLGMAGDGTAEHLPGSGGQRLVHSLNLRLAKIPKA